MKQNINISGNNQIFTYIVEYNKGINAPIMHNTYWHKDTSIKLFDNSIKYYRNQNEWYLIDSLDKQQSNLPNELNMSNIRVYIPTHSISTYIKGIKYALTINTWINGINIQLGSFIFSPNDTYAISNGSIKNGNNEYFECIDFNIIDPYYLIYSDNWLNFRKNVCNERPNLNNTCSSLYVSLYVVDEYENRYMKNNDYICGGTSFDISDKNDDYLSLNLKINKEPYLGLSLDVLFNKEYDDLQNYLYETYCINASASDIKFEFVIKNKNCIKPGPQFTYTLTNTYGISTQKFKWSDIIKNTNINEFFSNWNNFEEGWNIVSSLTIYNDNLEIFSIVSNEIPITQDVFSILINGGTEKIIDINDMEINQIYVVNKIENNIVQIERPNESKSNIVQPIFYKVNDTEMLTLHPNVTENISINLDNYKSKVDKFTLQIANCKFDQIGSNSYGVLFKIFANKLPEAVISGTYYILDDNLELVTTGKYNCIR